MKKILFFSILIVLLLVSIDSLGVKSLDSIIKTSNSSVSHYVFNQKNTWLKYKGIGNEYAEKQIFVDYILGNRIQYKIRNPGTTVCQIVEVKNGEIRIIYNQGEYYYRYNMLNAKNNKYDVILKEPIKKGTTWYSKDGNKRFINSINKKVVTPYKSFFAVEVITIGKDYKIYDYFVKNLGLVKTIFVSNETSIETTLEKIEKNTFEKQMVKFYYPNINNSIEYEERWVDFHTNDSVTEKFLIYLRKPTQKSHINIFDDKTRINSLIIYNNSVVLDISSDFLNYLNSKVQKKLILQSIVSTFGNYYNVRKVRIIVNKKILYENNGNIKSY